jgi:hypothetical protein
MTKKTPQTSRLSKFDSKQGGFLELIVVIIIALILLHVLGIDLKSVLAQPWVKDFFTYMIALLKIVWQDILEIVAFIKGLAS